MDWTFGRKLVLGFGLAVLIVMVVGAAGHRVTAELIETDRSVAHTQSVKRELLNMLSSMRAAETNQRGYILTGDESFIAPYREAAEQAALHLAEARRLTRDNAEQQQRLAQLAPLVSARLSTMAKVLEVRRNQGLDAAVASGILTDGKAEMAEVRTLVLEADAAENKLLTARQQRSEESAALAQTTIFWASLVGTLLIAAAGMAIARSLSTQIGVAVRHIQTSAAELQAAANQQAAGAMEQSTAMNEITTTISELLATSRQIA